MDHFDNLLYNKLIKLNHQNYVNYKVHHHVVVIYLFHGNGNILVTFIYMLTKSIVILLHITNIIFKLYPASGSMLHRRPWKSDVLS